MTLFRGEVSQIVYPVLGQHRQKNIPCPAAAGPCRAHMRECPHPNPSQAFFGMSCNAPPASFEWSIA